MSDSYEPYGEEWEKEMMQFRKKDLIERLRVVSKDRTPAISTSAQLGGVFAELEEYNMAWDKDLMNIDKKNLKLVLSKYLP